VFRAAPIFKIWTNKPRKPHLHRPDVEPTLVLHRCLSTVISPSFVAIRILLFPMSRSRDPQATSSSSSSSSNDDSTPHESPASDDGLCDGLDNDNSSSSAEGGEPLELPTAADFLAQAQDGLARLAVVEDSVARLFGSPSPPPPPVPLTLHVGITTHAPKKEARSDPFALIRPSVPTALRKLVLLLWTFDTGASVALDNRTLAASSSGWQRCCPADASPTDAN